MKKSANESRERKCLCPYCEFEIESGAAFCESCHVSLRRCPSCKHVVGKEAEECPECGAPLE